MTQLEKLLEPLKLNYVNPNITTENFPIQEVGTDFEVFTIDKVMTTKEVEEAMDEKGLRPANLYELLTWTKDNWNGNDWIIALGSGWMHSGNRYVPYLCKDGSKRYLDLRWGSPGNEWDGRYRFLALSKSGAGTLGSSALSDTVLGRLEILEAKIAKLEKIINF